MTSDSNRKAVSARGLFRATGHVSKPVMIASGAAGGAFAVADGLARAEDDFYPTPPEPTRALIAAERDALARFGRIWEPAAGDGAMMRELQAVGLDVYPSDLVDRGCGAVVRDFFDYLTPPARAIVTNPPYAECNWRDGRGRWIGHALDVLHIDYMALLLSWSWPGAGGLAGLWQAHPPARVYLMRWKIDFTGQGAPPMLHGWFVWDRHWDGEPALRMLDRIDPRQGCLFDEISDEAVSEGGAA